MLKKEDQQSQLYPQRRLGGGILIFIFLVCRSSSNSHGSASLSLAEAFVFPSPGESSHFQHQRRRPQQRKSDGGADVTVAGVSKHPLLMVPSSSWSPSSRSCRQTSKDRHQSSRLYATVAPSPTFRSLNDFNVHLERLADKCGSMNEPVISRAAECQEVWEREISKGRNNNENGGSGGGDFEPDIVSFRNMLTAWSRCTKTLAQSRRSADRALPVDNHATTAGGAVLDVYTPLDAAKRATSLLLAYPEPDLDSYNIVVDAWSKSRVTEAPDAAERLLRRMLDDGTAVEPDTNTYNLLIDAWANSKRENSLEKVMQIYKHMCNLNQQGKKITPNIRTINAVLNAHAKKVSQYTSQSSKEGYDLARVCADAAYGILQDAKKRYEESGSAEDMPDVMTYTSVMDVYSRCGTYGACQRAESLLGELKGLYATTKNQRYKLNFRTYTTVVTAWSRTRSDDSPKRVEALLQEMALDWATMPTSRTYTAAIQCWARSRDPQKAKRVLKILMDMREEYKKTGNVEVRPSTLSYNNAIDACARCQGSAEQQTEAIRIAFAILKTMEMDEAFNPNEGTYSTLIRAISFLMPAGKERNHLASLVFDKAKKAGLVEFDCVKNLHKTVDRETLRTLLDGRLDRTGVFKYQDLPPAWSRNVG